jgi:methionine-gamma-lyase
MMSYGYRPSLSEGALKCPIFQTSTFVFNSAEEGKAFFEVAYGLREQEAGESLGLIYSRLNNPDLEILEDRLTLWDRAEAAAVFESGMAAIATTVLHLPPPGRRPPLLGAHLRGNPVLSSGRSCPEFGIRDPGRSGRGRNGGNDPGSGGGPAAGNACHDLPGDPGQPHQPPGGHRGRGEAGPGGSTPERQVLVAVDNTFLGPLFQHPIPLGADLVLYSLTKYVGGHSDVIAGACLGSEALIQAVKGSRTFFGSMAGPWTGWLLMRSLETLKLRMTAQAENAAILADWLRDHPQVERVYYPGSPPGGRPRPRDLPAPVFLRGPWSPSR